MKLLILAIAACLAAAASSEKVVGGSPTTIDKYPWQVSLRWNRRHFCGGSIYDAKTIITAAHCLEDETASSISVLYGSTNAVTGITGTEVKAAKLIMHENYNSRTLQNDIGIVKLAEPIKFNDYSALMITINRDHARDLIGEKVRASGWGALYASGSSPNQLYAVEMPVIRQSQSNYTLAANYNDDVMMIAGMPGEGKDTCQGDSGGPLVLYEGNPLLVGITSWGYGCGFSGVYTRVSKYPQWIDTHAEPDP